MRSRTNSFCVSAIGAVALLSTAWISGAPASAQGTCVVPHGIAVSQIRGQVFDAFGIAVPFATVTVIGIRGAVQTIADNDGQFSFNVGPGHYALKAEAEGFAYSSAELKVGRNWQTLFGRQRLKVMLGFGDTYCPWVTTSNKDFQDTTEANFTRLKQSAQIQDASQTRDTSDTRQVNHIKASPIPQDIPETKETSQTHATQK
jgi:hypothetical protein